MSLHDIFHCYPKNFPLPLVLDGSTGTSLMREGMPAGTCTEKWVLENPEAIKKIQKKYVDSGSHAVYAPTFGANRPTLERNGFISDCAKVNRSLAELSVGGPALVGGDISPTGLFIEPFGDTPFSEVVEIYREQATALNEAGVDFFVSETNISLQEARAAVIGIRRASDKPIFVTMTVDDSGYTLGGDSLECCLLSLAELGISAFGTNCSEGPNGMLNKLRDLVPLSISLGIPLIAKPNAGLPHEDGEGHRFFDLSAEDFAKFPAEFFLSGIPIMGGCCGTDEKYISAIRHAADTLSLDYSGIVGLGNENIAATNRSVVSVSPAHLEKKIVADGGFFDSAMELADSGAELIFADLPDEAAADEVIAAAPMLQIPLAVTGNPAAITKLTEAYAGKLFIVK